jgi:hypothetical protein
MSILNANLINNGTIRNFLVVILADLLVSVLEVKF